MDMRQLILFLNSILLLSSLPLMMTSCNPEPQATAWSLSSPDGKLQMTVFLEDAEAGGNQLRYRVEDVSGDSAQTVIRSSLLGLDTGEQPFTADFTFREAFAPTTIDETYRVITGKQSEIRNHAREQRLVFENVNGIPVVIVMRAYDQGVAFRYRFPEGAESYTVSGERTEFGVPEKGVVWIQPYDEITTYTPAYERYFKDAIPIGTTSENKEGWCFPALFRTDSYWLLLSEADVDDSYFGSHLEAEAPGGTYRIRLPEADEGMDTGPAEASMTLPFETPWRLIMVSRDLGDIVESDLVRSLNEPNQLADTSWIQPGRASWSWWSDHSSSRSARKMRDFVDLAAEMGWEYSLIDANWNTIAGDSVKQLVDYANRKGVGILIWYNSGGPHNEVPEQPRDLMDERARRRDEFRKLHEWGVKGIKVDFFQSDKPHIMQLYQDIIRDAADYQIMVNFHGCTIPRGWSRTYPNLMTMESVRGAEVYSFSEEYPDHAPWHNTILPATRNVIGSMDYTPVTFSNQRYPHLTSSAHELALSVVFESGLMHFADRVSAYRALDEAPKNFLKAVPAAWDETRYLGGMPGQEMIIARRKGKDWFVGGINGIQSEKSFALSFDFLEAGEYEATLITDGDSPRSMQSTTRTVSSSDSEEVSMLPYGGFAVWLRGEN
jgi:hypothetical protein